jgi:hypothetical protein
MSVSVVARPRNHLNLHNRRVALIERPFFLRGQAQDAGEVAVKVDIKLAFCIGRQRDPVHERADQVCGFGAVLIMIERFRRVATRYDKLAANFLAMVQLASMRLWMRANEPTG